MKSSPLQSRGTAPRGFSLLEAVIVLAVIGILSSYGVSAFIYGSSQAKAKNATFELSALFSVAQLRATATGRPQYMALWQNAAGDYGAQLLDYTGAGTVPAWTTMTPGAPSASFTIIDQVRLSRSPVALSPLATARTFIPALKSPATAFPSPFQAVRWDGSGGASDLARACSFCVDQAGGALGVARFNINGTIDVLTGPSTSGGSFAIQVARPDTSTGAGPRVLAFTAPLSTLRIYQ